MRWLLETDLKKKLNDNQTVVQVHVFSSVLCDLFLQSLHPFQHILIRTDLFVAPAKANLYMTIKTQTLLLQTCSVSQSDLTLHLCSLSLDILLSVLQTAKALRKEYVFHQFQGRYPTLSPSRNFPHCPLNIANSNPKQHKLQKPPDQKHFHYALLKLLLILLQYYSAIVCLLHTKVFEKDCQECFNLIFDKKIPAHCLTKLTSW